MTTDVRVIGAGLAGCEAAWQLANRGIRVELCEMKPLRHSPAHKSSGFAELVCSNSLRAKGLANAVGLLKEEMRLFGSLVMQAADRTEVAAGGALAVDRTAFSNYITEKICSHPNIYIHYGEVDNVAASLPVIIAAGPLASEALINSMSSLTGEGLHFFDAAAPIVTAESIDMRKAFFASRYGKGDASYINCPMNREEYLAFWEALRIAETAELHEFDENPSVFEGCMPIEVMAQRGVDTMRFGPMKPVGIHVPGSTEAPYAVVQLRQDNSAASLFNIVGFQTHLKFGEQRRVFRMIPGLENAEFVRYGVMHRNTFINSPCLLNDSYALRSNPDIMFAGQITGVEGYVESAASGLLCGFKLAARLLGKELSPIGNDTAIGALSAYVSNPGATDFQPMNVNFGIMKPLERRIRGKKERCEAISANALEIVSKVVNDFPMN